MLNRLLRAGEGRTLRHLTRLAAEVTAREDEYTSLSDGELRAQTDVFRARLDDGARLDDLLIESFAVAREASRRVLGQRHFDVQVMGGAALHLGQVAEMRTGEGKTLTCVLPAYLNALGGRGVHVVTVNDYLAQRDSETMGRVHSFLGLDVGVLLNADTPAHRRVAYGRDITYGTNNEFGFDYLRDNMAMRPDQLVQRGHAYAIVDEVDSILIDEARTPLVISGPAELSTTWYVEFSRIVNAMRRDRDYEVDEMKRTVGVSEEGVALVEDQLGIENLYEPSNTPLVGYLNSALKVKELYRLDKEYVVVDGEVLIVDEFTGRVLAGRRYSDGLHQAIEAKEGVAIQNENQTLATITLQNYFRLYEKLAGMTGTAMTEASELHQTYQLGVVPIPTNQQMIREDHGDSIYLDEEAKFDAVVEDIAARHEAGQPVLVGTTSVGQSERLGELLRVRGVPHEVLNAKQHAREAHIIAQAGRRGAVTVATNMAGRGTDIILGGTAEFIAEDDLRAQGIEPQSEEWELRWNDALRAAKTQVQAEQEEVRGLGGLCVIGTERHESRRIDNQLRGRSGRQGDPGVSKFYLSLGDELMQRFNSTSVRAIMERLNLPRDVPLESKMVSRSIQSAQTQVEAQNFETRKNVLKYDEVLNRQRTVIYAERRAILEGADLSAQTRGMLEDVVTEYIEAATSEGYPEEWDLDELQHALEELYPTTLELPARFSDRTTLSAAFLTEEAGHDSRVAYEQREAELGQRDDEPRMRELERDVLLHVLDRKWREHLYEMDYLQEGIGLRAMGQRDPLIEYQREAFDMFNQMLAALKEEVVVLLFKAQMIDPPPPAPTEEPGRAESPGTEVTPTEAAPEPSTV